MKFLAGDVLTMTADAPQTNGLSLVNGNGARKRKEGLDIVIVGAGIGGLTAAIFLRQQGHRVTILEQSRLSSEVGAAIHLAPNCNGLLRRLGIYAEKYGANVFEMHSDYDSAGNRTHTLVMEELNHKWQHPWHLIHRVHLHEELKRRATCKEDKGRPADLRTGSRVESVDPHSATAVLESGERITGDVILGADGVHSKTRAQLPGGNLKVHTSGKSAFRFLVPRKVAYDDPKTRKYVENHGELIIWFGADRRVVMYPCSNNELLNFVCIHPFEESEVQGDGWNEGGNKQKLLDTYKGWDPSILALLDKVEVDSLKNWNLLDMPKLPTWVNDRLAVLGDAAHPFTPHQGQGAGCAMEDAAALAVVLSKDCPPEEIPERLRLYEQIRYERAHKIQEFSRVAGRDVDPNRGINMQENHNYNIGHDEWDNSMQALRKWDWARKPHLYWRMPIAFGPMPGPRQDFYGTWPRDASRTTFRTASIKIKTSATLLKNLFPTSQFKFSSPGTIAYCSFSQTTLNGMDWLGGGGYNHLGLYIHGVQFTKKNGDVINGTYMPLLFESLTDPIVSGREELGMPKLYCSIDIYRRSHQYRIQTGWQGTTFGNFDWEGLEEQDTSTDKGTIGGTDDDGILVYRYIPRVGDRGKADMEHAVFVPHKEDAKIVPSKVKKVLKAQKASFSWDPMDWEALPTLHHIISRLAEIPVYEVIQGKIVEGEGVPDVSAARRVD